MTATVFPPCVEDEIYRGYELEDLDRVAALEDPGRTAAEGFIVDYFGTRTSVARAPWLAHRGGEVIRRLPFPDDGFLADGIEYAAMALALEHAGRDRFTFLEVGAGWGPWTALAGVLGRRLGFRRVDTIGIEADRARFRMMQSHLHDNGLLKRPDALSDRVGAVHVRAIRAAGWWRDETLFFPSNASPDDAGLAVTTTGSAEDYRGQRFEHEEVPAVSIPALCAKFPVVDYMHIDIQGAEWDLVSKALAFFNGKVRMMLVGSHSRKIEGDLIDLLYRNNWLLFREKPCRFWGMARSPTLVGLTAKDGAQLWRNLAIP